MALEDPFDNMGLDGIYLDEALYEVEQVGPFAQLSRSPISSAVLPSTSLLLLRTCTEFIIKTLVQCLNLERLLSLDPPWCTLSCWKRVFAGRLVNGTASLTDPSQSSLMYMLQVKWAAHCCQ